MSHPSVNTFTRECEVHTRVTDRVMRHVHLQAMFPEAAKLNCDKLWIFRDLQMCHLCVFFVTGLCLHVPRRARRPHMRRRHARRRNAWQGLQAFTSVRVSPAAMYVSAGSAIFKYFDNETRDDVSAQVLRVPSATMLKTLLHAMHDLSNESDIFDRIDVTIMIGEPTFPQLVYEKITYDDEYLPVENSVWEMLGLDASTTFVASLVPKTDRIVLSTGMQRGVNVLYQLFRAHRHEGTQPDADGDIFRYDKTFDNSVASVTVDTRGAVASV